MKSIVKFSRFSTWLTIIINGALIFGCCVTVNEKPAFYILLTMLLILLITVCLYAPLSIKADKDAITVVSLLKKHIIPMSDVANVELFQPTMGAIRLCASGGYAGYWGLFSEGDMGKYTAYYGKASDCFLVTTKNGKKYVLGCENPDAMIDYIKAQL